MQDNKCFTSFRWTLKWVAEARQYNERFLKDLMGDRSFHVGP